MKNLALTIVFSLFVSILFGQIPEDAISIEDVDYNDYFFANPPPVVKGKVLNLNNSEVDTLKISYSTPTPLSQYMITKTCSLNPDGTFELELDYPFPYQQIWFELEPFIFTGIYANTELFMEIDANKMRKGKVNMYGNGVNYSGEDKELNLYFNKYSLYKFEEKREIRRKLNGYNLTNGLDSIFAQLVAIDDDFIRENPSKYSWLLKNERLSEYLTKICLQHWDKKMSDEIWEKVKQHKVYMTSNYGMLFYKYLHTYLRLLRDELNFGKFRNYSKLTPEEKSKIDTIVAIKKRNINNPAPVWIKYSEYANEALTFLRDTMLVSNTTRCIRLLDSTFQSPKADMLKLKFKGKAPGEQKILLDLIINHTQTEWCNEVNKKEYEINMTKINYVNATLKESETLNSDSQIGTPLLKFPFGAELYQVDTLSGLDLLSNIKNKFKGKALLIDFWATWCAPCLREMPISNKLHNEFKNAPIEFIYLCTAHQSSVEKWKSKIAELNIAGIHIFIKGVIHDELMSLFSATAVPSYVFIDSNGNYIPGAFSRPSNIDENEFKKLINE